MNSTIKPCQSSRHQLSHKPLHRLPVTYKYLFTYCLAAALTFDDNNKVEIIVGIAINAYIKVIKLITIDNEPTAPAIMSNK